MKHDCGSKREECLPEAGSRHARTPAGSTLGCKCSAAAATAWEPCPSSRSLRSPSGAGMAAVPGVAEWLTTAGAAPLLQCRWELPPAAWWESAALAASTALPSEARRCQSRGARLLGTAFSPVLCRARLGVYLPSAQRAGRCASFPREVQREPLPTGLHGFRPLVAHEAPHRAHHTTAPHRRMALALRPQALLKAAECQQQWRCDARGTQCGARTPSGRRRSSDVRAPDALHRRANETKG